MKITDTEWNIQSILDMHKGQIHPGSVQRSGRPSDCFVYILTGQATYFFHGKPQIAAAGNILYLSCNSSYFIEVTDPHYTYICIDFLFDHTGNPPFENAIYRSKGISTQENTFERMYNLWKFGDFSDKIYCKSLLYRIYSEVAKSVLSQYLTPYRKTQIETVVNFISGHLADSDLSVKQLSDMCRLSEVHFRRIFASVYHQSPVKFITDLRIKKAKELLMRKDCSIASVAESCGFQNPYYFSKVFKTEMHMTPSEFRHLYQFSS